MPESFSITSSWIQNKIFWLLLIVPLCFKIEILPSVIIMPQEVILPILIGLYFLAKGKFNTKMSIISMPYIYLLMALILTLILTVFSLFYSFDLVGLLKIIKYSIYVIAIIIISNYTPTNFIKILNKITITTIVLTLIIFYLNKIESGKIWATYVAMATYVSSYMPTGFSNRVLNLQSGSFVIYSGNHGIYGSYLALILFFNFSSILRSKRKNFLGLLTIILCFINLMLLTSRETFLLIFITIFTYSFYYVSYKKFNPSKLVSVFILFVLFLLLIIWAVNYFDIELSIINKVENSIRKFREEGGDGSVDVRLNTWLLILIFLFTNPLRVIFGTGFNPTLFREKIDFVASQNPDIGKYVGIPESLFLQFLSYGGIVSLFFIFLFFYSLYKNVWKVKNISVNGMFIPFFLLGLFVTNNTGASILAELLMTQFALVYVFIMNDNINEYEKNSFSNC
ncbi:O-antigen ligase family protein [Aestuariibaculum suncheonense]|uniref:O-antigen ligase-related domain-containing protein n=1 Tax=Aestuariibaculum suncheonense TaxID=1028745 RepID=A0A8J6QCY0_9FLAO|nr:O-antigen ligase family protein [Aestuariibaculum suncheonense]MBD0833811.1 hypothetical protein [Aestuariibaculum suncheonense]